MSITFRTGTLDDTYATFVVFRRAIKEVARRLGALDVGSGNDDADIAALWEGQRRSLAEHLTRTAEQFHVAEKDGQVIGYARATLRDGVRELTDFFVMPGHQAAGVGRELLARAFPANGARQRLIIATMDARAQTRYLKAGMFPQFPIYGLERPPEAVAVPDGWRAEPITATDETLAALAEIDQTVLGFRRDADHRWLLANRPGYLYHRDGRRAGYGYVGSYAGPMALLDANDFPAALAHAESAAAAAHVDEFSVEVPAVNRVAIQYLLARGCKLSPFIVFLMSDGTPGDFRRYIVTSPPLFV